MHVHVLYMLNACNIHATTKMSVVQYVAMATGKVQAGGTIKVTYIHTMCSHTYMHATRKQIKLGIEALTNLFYYISFLYLYK